MEPRASTYRFGPYESRPQTSELYKDGTKLKVRPQPLLVLNTLLSRAGEVVTREELRQRLWSAETFVDFEHSLNTSVKEIRAVLADSASEPRYIETLPRIGYRFIATVEANGGEVTTSAPVSARVEGQGSAALPEERKAHGLPWRWNTALAIASALILAAAGYWGWARAHAKAPAASARIRSLAVLPLRNLSGDPSQEYLADGITEALIGRLSQIHDLRVTSHTSVMRFKNPQMSIPEIAKMLGVDAIVEGSVMRQGDQIRATAELIRGATDEHFWSQTYDRQMQDVFALQSELAQTIAAKVEVSVTGAERERLIAVRPVSPDVYESYLKGRYADSKAQDRAGIEASMAYFNEAIAKDPTFAPAYTALAESYSELATVFAGAPPEEARSKAISAARKALELDPNLVEAHSMLADLLQQEWQWKEAEAEFKRALELNMNDAATHIRFAYWLLCHGRTDEALTWAQRARELDPSMISGENIGWILFQSHRYDEAIRELRSVLAVDPNDANALLTLGFTLTADNQPQEAIPVLEKSISITKGSPAAAGVLIRAYAHAGRRDDALRVLAELQKRQKSGYVPAGAFVNGYLGLDDKEAAFIWLERAYKEKSNILQFVKTHPYFDPIRGDPRFVELVRRVGLG